MDPISHVLAGVMAAEIVAPSEIEPWALAAATGVTLAPDIDFLTRRLGHIGLLRYHHTVTHSIPGGIVISAAWAGLLAPFSPVPWAVLLMFALLGFGTHILLDLLLHNNGVLLGWPFIKKPVRWGLFLGLNPLTSSARCGERKLTVCIACQTHSLVFSRAFLVLSVTAVIGTLAGPWRREVFMAGAIILAAMIGHLAWNRKKAARLAGHHLGEIAATFPASFGSNEWLAVVPVNGGYRTAIVDLRQGVVRPPIGHTPAPPNLVQESKIRPSVQAFLNWAIVPFAEIAPGGRGLWWRDLSYDFTPAIQLHTLKLDYDEAGKVVAEEFRERWS